MRGLGVGTTSAVAACPIPSKPFAKAVQGTAAPPACACVRLFGNASMAGSTLLQQRPVCRASSSDDANNDAVPSASCVPNSLPLVAPGSDWRAFRAQLVRQASATGVPGARRADEPWAHSLTAPERGCLLLANPLMFTSAQQYFHLAVILVTAHEASGTVGLIINKPTEHRIGDLATCNMQPHFDRCRLYLGGDCDPSAVHILHALPPGDCPGAQELMPGVQLGGFEGVRQALAEGRASPEEVKVLTRYAGWGPGQLAAELARGVWYVAAASPHLVMKPAAAAGGEGPEVWHAVMALMGGEHAALSAAMKEQYRADVMEAPAEERDAAEAMEEAKEAAPAQGQQEREEQRRQRRWGEPDKKEFLGEWEQGGGCGRDPESWKGSGI